MKTNKDVLVKGLKYLFITVLLMFLAPTILYQAFKNQGHPFYWPVLIMGLVLAVAAIAGGFYSIKVILDGFFGKKSD